MTEVLSDNPKTKARKRHKCEWCGEWIEVSEIHRVQSGIFDHELYRWHAHTECYSAMMDLWKIDRFALEDGFEPHGYKRGTMTEK